MSNYKLPNDPEQESEVSKKIMKDLEEHWKIEDEKSPVEKIPQNKKLICHNFINGLPINVLRHLILPSALGFLLYRNLLALLGDPSVAVVLLAVISSLFFSSVAVYASFNFLKAQIAFKASSREFKLRITYMTLQSVLFNRAEGGTPYFLKRQWFIIDLLMGLVVPTGVFMLVFMLMSIGGVFATKIVYVIVPLIIAMGFLNEPVNNMRDRAGKVVKRVG